MTQEWRHPKLAPARSSLPTRRSGSSARQKLLASPLPVLLAAKPSHHEAIRGLISQPHLPLADHISPLDPDIENSALNLRTVPVPFYGDVDSPAEQIVQLKRSETSENGTTVTIVDATLLKVEKLKWIREAAELQEVEHSANPPK